VDLIDYNRLIEITIFRTNAYTQLDPTSTTGSQTAQDSESRIFNEASSHVRVTALL
jgi:hypothetical protein